MTATLALWFMLAALAFGAVACGLFPPAGEVAGGVAVVCSST
jgi:hypothetical protein